MMLFCPASSSLQKHLLAFPGLYVCIEFAEDAHKKLFEQAQESATEILQQTEKKLQTIKKVILSTLWIDDIRFVNITCRLLLYFYVFEVS